MSIVKVVLIISLVAVVLVGVGAGAFFYFLQRWDSEQPSKKDTLKPEVSKIAGRALIIYHPGATGYTEEVAYAMGKALQTKGWEVHLDRANSRAVSDLSEFNLLCVGSPTYMENRVCLIFATGSSNPEEANKKMQNHFEAKGSKVVSSLALLTKQKDELEELTREFVEKIIKLIEDGN